MKLILLSPFSLATVEVATGSKTEGPNCAGNVWFDGSFSQEVDSTAGSKR